MEIEQHHQDQFATASATPISPAELFLPDLEAVVRHLARMAAERDYAAFLSGVEVRYDLRDQEDHHA